MPPSNSRTLGAGRRAASWCAVTSLPLTTFARSTASPAPPPPRTAYDLGRRLPLETAVIRMDALLNATTATPQCVEDIARCHRGARGIRRLRTALDLVDGGAESPQETRLRLLLVQSGLPRPVTQIPVTNSQGRVVRRIDMGWREWKVGAEYDTDERSREEYSTPSSTSPTPTTTRTTSSAWSSLLRRGGRSCE
jgi:hypothetical protein